MFFQQGMPIEISELLYSQLIENQWIKTILIGLFVILAIWKILDLYGVFRPVCLVQEMLPKMAILYKKKMGKYQGDQYIYNQIKAETFDTFKISKYITIFYDDPIDTDPAKCRSIIGIAVNDGQYKKIDEFLRENKKYQLAFTRPTKCYSYSLPFISPLSFLISSFKVYKIVRKCRSKKQDIKFSDFTIQIYNHIPGLFSKSIKIATLIQNFEDFYLFPQKNIQYQQ